MLNDWIRPIGDVERAVGADFYVDGTEGDVGRAHQVWKFLCDVTGALIVDAEAHNAMRAKIARHDRALPIRREMFALDDLEAAEFRIISGTHAVQNFSRTFVSDIHRLRNNPIDSFAPRAIGGE